MKIRIKFGKNPYSNKFICAFCGCEFVSGGFIIRLEHAGIIVDIPMCQDCIDFDSLYEGMIDMSQHSTSHKIGTA